MTPLERKMLEYAKTAQRMNRLALMDITEEKYNREYDKSFSQFKKLASEIHKEIETQQNELERIEVFFRIVSGYNEPWYKIKGYAEEKSKYIPKVIYGFVSKILEKESVDEKRLTEWLSRVK